MKRGGNILCSVAVMALAGCGGSDAKLAIRSIPAPLSATAKPVPYRIAEAHGQLALGNVALAIESFRKALREQPDSVDAMVGLAASYDLMTRHDLSRRYYESALAVAPADTRVLTAFARSLEAQGQTVEAAAMRKEIRVRSAAAVPAPAPVIQAPIAPQRVAQALPPALGPSVTVKLPPARPVAVAAKRPAEAKALPITPPAKPEPRVAAAMPAHAAPVAVASKPVAPLAVAMKAVPIAAPAPIAVALKPVEAKPIAALPPAPVVPVAIKPVEAQAAVLPPMPVVAATKPVEVKRPALVPAAPVAVAIAKVEPQTAPAPAVPDVAPRRPVELAAAPAQPVPTPVIAQPVKALETALPAAPEPVEIAQKTPPALVPEAPAGPRLERLSLGEVALITTDGPQWRSKVVSRSAQSTTIRFVPLRQAAMRPVRIRLLNAARYEGLAARHRRLLAQRGWRQLAIGNARRVRQSSLVLYPAHKRALAKRLAAQFGIALAKNPSGTDLVVLLGRDAARRNPVRGG